MPNKATCEAVLAFGDETLHCELPASHTKPTGALPQGSPHMTSERADNLSGEPMTWWG